MSHAYASLEQTFRVAFDKMAAASGAMQRVVCEIDRYAVEVLLTGRQAMLTVDLPGSASDVEMERALMLGVPSARLFNASLAYDSERGKLVLMRTIPDVPDVGVLMAALEEIVNQVDVWTQVLRELHEDQQSTSAENHFQRVGMMV